MEIVITVIVIILILSIVILLHELGHFFTARAIGVRVYEFGIGFPPRLFAFKRGEVEYSLNAIPIGAFVKMAGREDSSPRSLASKKPWTRLAVSAAGPVANILLAFILFSIAFMIPTTIVTGGEGVKIESVAPGSPAAEAGIQEEDIILSVEGQPVQVFEDISSIIADRQGAETEMVLQRDGEEIYIKLTPRVNPPQGEGPIGVELGYVTKYTTVHRYSFKEAITGGASIIIHVPLMIKEIIRDPGSALMGPVGAAQVTGEMIEYGIAPTIGIAGSISLGVALFNFIPIPPLDGAGMLLAIIELVRHGKRLSIEKERLIYMLGTAFLIMLTVVIWYNDILRLIRG